MQINFVILILALLACVLAQENKKSVNYNQGKKKIKSKQSELQVGQAHARQVKASKKTVQTREYRGVSTYSYVKPVKAVKSQNNQRKQRGVASYTHIKSHSQSRQKNVIY